MRRSGSASPRRSAGYDIGQTVVVKHGTVLAVEAFEGTNAAIAGGAQGRGKALVAKVSKPDQDFRFDVPVVGPATVEARRRVAFPPSWSRRAARCCSGGGNRAALRGAEGFDLRDAGGGDRLTPCARSMQR
ncbi:MAG: UDP-2,3-diacylglucosamine diphosphatase LpxI [Verrucomicrobiales bacterium]